jgi:thiol-disulfide isomerase/thioredoxin
MWLPSDVAGVWVLIGVLALTGGTALWWRRANGRLRPAPHATDRPSLPRDLVDELVPTPGERATLIQFSSAFCAPCRATRRILDDVVAVVPGVVHVEIDAESHLEAVRTLDVRRTPTVLVLDAQGRLVARASGQPRKEDVLGALALAVG